MKERKFKLNMKKISIGLRIRSPMKIIGWWVCAGLCKCCYKMITKRVLFPSEIFEWVHNVFQICKKNISEIKIIQNIEQLFLLLKPGNEEESDKQ